MESKAVIKINSPILPVLLGVFLVMEILDPSKVWIVLLIGFGSAGLTSYLWVRALSRGLKIRREMRFGWTQVGDRLEERFTLTNQAGVPALWVEVVDLSTLPGYEGDRVTGVDGHSTLEWHTDALCTRRGLYTLGPTAIRTSDPFGVFTVQLTDPASRAVMVMPPVVSLPAIQVAIGGRTGQGRERANAAERTVSSGSVREYVPGDSLHDVHWRTSARRNAFFVRVFEGTSTGDWRIILDLDQAVQVGQGWDSTEEHGVILAASMADQGLRLRRSVGLAVNSKQFVWLPSRQGENYRWEILRALTLVEPGQMTLKHLLKRVESDLHASSSLVIVTPAAGGEWLEEVLPLIWRGVSLTVLLLDPDTFLSGEQEHPGDLLPSASQAKKTLLRQLADYGIHHYLISKELLDRTEARPGREGHWEWRFTPRGRAIPVKKPADLSWRTLA